MYWVNNAAYLYVEDGDLFVRDEDVYDFKIDFMDSTTLHHRDTDMKVSLLDIARPAKQKGKKRLLLLFNNGSLIIIIKTGVAKDFEVVKKVRNVVALEDGLEDHTLGYQWEDYEWDEWEQIYDTTEKRSYSSVLKGKEDLTTFDDSDRFQVDFRPLNDERREHKT